MKPRVIVHSSVSLDGSVTGFDVSLGTHYDIVREYGAGANLIGSNTLIAGIEQFLDEEPEEREEDMHRPPRREGLPIWAIIDSRGTMLGKLHIIRRFEYCRDVIVFITGETPQQYRSYLDGRGYESHVVGRDAQGLKDALSILHETYGVGTVITDTGPTLNGLLLDGGLVDELSLLVHPIIVGRGAKHLFGTMGEGNVRLTQIGVKRFEHGPCWLRYEIH